MATVLCSQNNENNILSNQKTNNLTLSGFKFPERHPSAKNLMNDIKEINDLNNFISNSKDNQNLSQILINGKNTSVCKKISNYNINITPTITELYEKNEVFFIKNFEPIKKKSNCLKIPKVNISSFDNFQIKLDNKITELIQKGEEYENIYNNIFLNVNEEK